MSGNCTVLHDEFVGGLHIVFIDVTEGADDTLDKMMGRDILISVHRHPEREDGRMTYLAEELGVDDIDFDWAALGLELSILDEGWLGFASLRSTEALWSIVTPRQVWSAVVEVKKREYPSVRGSWEGASQ